MHMQCKYKIQRYAMQTQNTETQKHLGITIQARRKKSQIWGLNNKKTVYDFVLIQAFQ